MIKQSNRPDDTYDSRLFFMTHACCTETLSQLAVGGYLMSLFIHVIRVTHRLQPSLLQAFIANAL